MRVFDAVIVASELGEASSGNPPFHKAAEADQAVGTAYVSLVALKGGFDQMQEIPAQYAPLYREIGKAIDALVAARNATNQVREMTRKVAK